MEFQLHQTREAWLNYVARRMASIFETLKASRPAQHAYRRVLEQSV
jgi:hypothetical protein